ncbi:MAG: glycosyltransferase family 2 protein [Defluviitaleaceae bacterium]|nr:glycosyltransferase family 2 protein [Defluviitaleaceae bacterium]
MSKLSIIIPVYFSADTLMDCYLDLKENVLGKIEDYELILVDDGSGDNSYEVCLEIASCDDKVRLIKLSRNFGSHAACFAGMVACTGDCCTIKAADLQEPSTLILDMYERWKKGNRVVLAVREDREDSLSQKMFANMYYGLVKKFVSTKMPASGFDCYLLDRKAIEALKLLDERNSAITLQILWSGFKTDTVSYTRLARQKGTSRWTLGKKIKLVIDSFVSFSPAPIRFIEWVGAIFAIGAGVWGTVLIILGFLGVIDVQGWVTLMVVILFSSGLILLVLGILGEYIWRILDVAQNRPVYFIEEEK